MTKQPAAAVESISVPSRRFSHVHLDIVGPLPTSPDGYKYLLTMVDRSTRWLTASPLKDMEAATVAATFCRDWVAAFGVPVDVTTDRGTQFTSSVWAALCNKLGMNHITTTAYHPQSNGMVERTHRQLKDSLRSRAAGNDWPAHLPWVLLGLRAAPKEDSNLSSAELVFGAPLTLPGDFLDDEEPPAAEFLAKMQASPFLPPPTRPLTYAQAAATPPAALGEAQFVYIRKGGSVPPLSQLYAGPYRVLRRQPKFFELEIGGKSQVVSVDRLKPHLGPSAVTAATPPGRGRPARPS